MSNDILQVKSIQFFLFNYITFPKAERINFYLSLINIPFQLNDLEKKYSAFLSGFSLQLKDSTQSEFDGNETVVITSSTDVCFFYSSYRILFFLDLSQSLLLYDYEEKIINIEKIETYLKPIIESFFKFKKTIYTLKLEQIAFTPKLAVSIASATNEDDLNILCHEIYFNPHNFSRHFDVLVKKLKTIIMNYSNKKVVLVPPLTSMNGFPQVAPNPGNLPSYIKTQMMYLNKIFEHSLYILDLLPRTSSPLLFLLTDSNLCLSKIGKYNNILMQLGRVDMTTHVIDLFSQNYPSNLSSPAYINSVAIMKYISKFTNGHYFSEANLKECLNQTERMKARVPSASNNMVNFDLKQRKNSKELPPFNLFESQGDSLKCKICNCTCCIFFCKKPYQLNQKQPLLKIRNDLVEKFSESKESKGFGYNITSIDSFLSLSETKIMQSELFETYQLKVPLDLISEARIRESFHLKQGVNPMERNCFYINIFPEIQILYILKSKRSKEPNNDFNPSDCEEFTVEIKIKAAFSVLNSLKVEYIKNSHEIATMQSMKTSVELLINFIKEVMCTDKLISFFCANFSEEKDFQSEKDNFINNNKLLWDLMGNLSLHSWHRFFNVEIMELFNKTSSKELLNNEVMMLFIKREGKFPALNQKSKSFIENQIFKFVDIQKRDLNFGIKLIPKSSNNSNKKYINGFMLVKFNWLCENLCLIFLGFFQAFHHTRVRYKQKFMDDLNNSTLNNPDMTIELSTRHLTFLLSNELNSSLPSSTSSLPKSTKKKNIENYYIQKDLENFKNQCGSIFTYRASKKLINSYLIKKVANYSSPWQYSVLKMVKFLITQRIKENFSILNWNNDTITLISKIQVTKINNLDEADLDKTITRYCLLLYSITLNANREEFNTELLIEPNAGFFLWKVSEFTAKVYDEKNFDISVTNYFKNSENKITEWVKCYANIIKEAIGNKLKDENISKQTRKNFYVCYMNQNNKELMDSIDEYKKELKEYALNFQAQKRNNFTSDSFIRTLTFISEKEYDILDNTTIASTKTKESSDCIKRFCHYLHEFFAVLKDYSIKTDDHCIYYGKLFTQSTILFIVLPSRDYLLQQLLQENEEKPLMLRIKFYYLTVDTLKPLDKSFIDILGEKEPLRTYNIKENTSIDTNKKSEYWNAYFTGNASATAAEAIKDHSVFKISIELFLAKFYSYIDFFMKIIIKGNCFFSYVMYKNDSIERMVKDSYSFTILYPLNEILREDQEGHSYIMSKFEEVIKASFIPLTDNFYCNERPSAEDTDHSQDSDAGLAPFSSSNKAVTNKFIYMMELILVIHNEQHVLHLSETDKIQSVLDKLNWNNSDKIELKVVYYFIPTPLDVFTELSKESFIYQSMRISIINTNNYSIYYNENNSHPTSKQIPIFIESEKEEFFIKINSKLKKDIENFDKHISSLNNLIQIERLRSQINSTPDAYPKEIAQGFDVYKNISDKYFYKVKQCFQMISNENVFDYLKYETKKESDLLTFDFTCNSSNNNHFITRLNKHFNQNYDTKPSQAYSLPLWVTLIINKNDCGGRRGSLNNCSDENIYIEAKWFRFFPGIPDPNEIAEINSMLIGIIATKINNINQRIMIDILKKSNEYRIGRTKVHYSNENLLYLDEKKKDDSYYFKKDIERFFKNPVNNTFNLDNSIDEVYKSIKEEFASHYAIENISDYYKMTSKAANEEDQLFIIKVILSEELKSINGTPQNRSSKGNKIEGSSSKRVSSYSNIIQSLAEKRSIVIQLYGIVNPSMAIIKQIKDIVSEKIQLVKLITYMNALNKCQMIKMLPEYEIFNFKTYHGPKGEKLKLEKSKQIDDVLKVFFAKTFTSWQVLYTTPEDATKLDLELLMYFSDKLSLLTLLPQFKSLTVLNKVYFHNLVKFYQLFRRSQMKMIEFPGNRNCMRIIIPGEQLTIKSKGGPSDMSFAFLITVINEGDDYEEYYVNTFELLKRKEIDVSKDYLTELVLKKEDIGLMIYQFLEDLLYVSTLVFVKKK